MESKETVTAKEDVNIELLLADIMSRLSLIEGVIFDKGFITKEEYVKKLGEKATELASKINSSSKINNNL